ncbi:MAG: hypothetical protein GTO60_03580, partial [Gammaproteobacteria bacterium]|nr:hypothetical protein [Gammaproteobacteria bacterium]NIO61546.1 hypothetical protein [Gammaproteobacteria bacterium]
MKIEKTNVAEKYITIFCRQCILLFCMLTASLIFVNSVAAQQVQDLPEGLIRYADYIFTNGQVLTADADEDFTIAEAVA